MGDQQIITPGVRSYIQWVSARIGDYGIMGQLHPVVIWFDAWWLLIDKLGFVGFLYQLKFKYTYLFNWTLHYKICSKTNTTNTLRWIVKKQFLHYVQ